VIVLFEEARFMKQKSPTVAFLLAFFFGPLGMLYTSFSAFFVFMVIELLMAGLGMFFMSFVIFCVHCACNVYMAIEHNKKAKDWIAPAEVPVDTSAFILKNLPPRQKLAANEIDGDEF
jgi:hypothetical protein